MSDKTIENSIKIDAAGTVSDSGNILDNVNLPTDLRQLSIDKLPDRKSTRLNSSH